MNPKTLNPKAISRGSKALDVMLLETDHRLAEIESALNSHILAIRAMRREIYEQLVADAPAPSQDGPGYEPRET